MSNPFKPHASNLFADRESIDAVMIYVNNVVNSMEPGQDRIAATTAIMILVNTAAKLWPEAPTQVADEPLAVRLSMVQADLDHRLVALANRVGDLEQSLGSTARVGWTRDELVTLAQSEISDWADEQFDERADTWLNDHADLDHEIERWMENNLDIENEVRDVLSSVNLSLTF